MDDYWKDLKRNIKVKPVNNFAKRTYSFIKKNKGKKMLELGFGIGQDTLYFARKGFDITCVDISKDCVKLMQERIKKEKISNINVVQKDLAKINFEDNSFDIVYSHLSLHYFNDKVTTELFNKIHKMLKPNGLFFVKCKSEKDNLYGIGELIEKNMYIINRHVRHFFTKGYMKEKLDKFKIVKIRRTTSKYDSYKSSFVEAIARK